MSALGARPKARSRYHRSKWEAEEIVRGSSLDSTIFRPSVIFGAGNSFLPQVRALLRRGRVIPIIGDGMSLLQPVWVEDVVSCFVGALDNADTVGQAYELGGAETLSFEQLLDLLAEADGIEKPKVHLPVWIMRPVVAAMSGLLPNFPITSDQLTMLLEDNTCDITAMRETFGIEPASVRDHLSD
jgi:NADH dehydrogenase